MFFPFNIIFGAGKFVAGLLLPDYALKNGMNPEARQAGMDHLRNLKDNPSGFLRNTAEHIRNEVQFDPKNPRTWGQTAGQVIDLATPEAASSRKIDMLKQNEFIQNQLSQNGLNANNAIVQNGKNTHLMIDLLPPEVRADVMKAIDGTTLANGKTGSDAYLKNAREIPVGQKVVETIDLSRLPKDLRTNIGQVLETHGVVPAQPVATAQAAGQTQAGGKNQSTTQTQSTSQTPAGQTPTNGQTQTTPQTQQNPQQTTTQHATQSSTAAAGQGQNQGKSYNFGAGVDGGKIYDKMSSGKYSSWMTETGTIRSGGMTMGNAVGKVSNSLTNRAGGILKWTAAYNALSYSIGSIRHGLSGDSEKAAESWDAAKSYGQSVGVMAVMGQAMKRAIPYLAKGVQSVSVFGRSIPGVAAVAAVAGGVVETGFAVWDASQGNASWAKPVHSLLANTVEAVGGFFGGPAGMAARQGYVELVKRFTPTDPQNVPWDCAAVAAYGAVKSIVSDRPEADMSASPSMFKSHREAMGQVQNVPVQAQNHTQTYTFSAPSTPVTPQMSPVRAPVGRF